MTDRQFKGVWIPAEIWLDKRLTLVEKALLAEIESFTGNGRSFHKCNQTIQEEYGISRNTVGRSINKLAKLGFLDVTFNGRVRCVRTRAGSIPKMGRQHPQMSAGSIPKMGRQHPQNGEAASPNDTSTNTIYNTEENTFKKEEVHLPFEDEAFKEMWDIWKQERRDRGIRKYTKRGEQSALHNLYNLSNQNHETAIEIIKQSIANGWQGLFELKTSNNKQRPNLDAAAALKWATQ